MIIIEVIKHNNNDNDNDNNDSNNNDNNDNNNNNHNNNDNDNIDNNDYPAHLGAKTLGDADQRHINGVVSNGVVPKSQICELGAKPAPEIRIDSCFVPGCFTRQKTKT